MASSLRETRRRRPDADETALGLWVDRVGLHRDGAAWFRAPRILGLHAVCAAVRGSGALRDDGTAEAPLQTGDAWWLLPEQAANYGPAAGTRWDHVAIVFAGPLADTLAARLRGTSAVSPGAGPAVEEAFRRLLPLAGAGGAAAAAARLAGLLPALVRYASAPDRDDARMAEALADLARHPAGAVDVPALARRVGLSASQLRRLFATRCGCGPAAWLLRLRLERARELLAATDQPVGEVARTCGFADPFWFSRVFRRECGASPQAWRGAALHRADARGGPADPRR